MDTRPRWNRPRRAASSANVQVPIGFRETGGTANAGSKRNGMWRSSRAAFTASHTIRPSGKSKAAMKGEKLNGSQDLVKRPEGGDGAASYPSTSSSLPSKLVTMLADDLERAHVEL